MEALVRRWLDLRLELSRVDNDWKEQKALLLDELKMLESEKDRLEKTLDAQKENVMDAEASYAEAKEQRDVYVSAFESLKPSLHQASDHLKQWSRMLPSFDLHLTGQAFAKLDEFGSLESPNDLAQALKLVFSLYSQLEHLNCGIRSERYVIKDPEGAEREMDVIFMGLAAGFAVSPDDTLAAAGRITRQGVIWDWNSELAVPVRNAWSCYQNEEPAAFVRMPLVIEDTSE